MERTERFYRIQTLLKARRAVRMADFLAELEISKATFKRDIEYLRSRMHVPIVWDRESGGYRLEAGVDAHELPGLWFSAQEVHALLMMHHLLASLSPALVKGHLEPLLERLESIIGSRGHTMQEVRRRIRLIEVAHRSIALTHFEKVSHALLERRQLHIGYFARGSNTHSMRDVSPQRLVHYRDNWYLDAWCHLRNDLRSFAVDAIESARVLDTAAIAVPDATLDDVLASGYGIFSGAQVSWATLRFSAARARWVAAESWHPQQRSQFDAAGRYILEVPFADPRELVMDILKHGPQVEVLAPESLRHSVQASLDAALAQYR